MNKLQIFNARRDALEANWGWSDDRGSIPFKRPRLTPVNIEAQERIARPGKLIHLALVPEEVCKRKFQDIDVTFGKQVTSLSIASHIENVNCLRCRKYYYGLPKG